MKSHLEGVNNVHDVRVNHDLIIDTDNIVARKVGFAGFTKAQVKIKKHEDGRTCFEA
jgi:hypothetical protein